MYTRAVNRETTVEDKCWWCLDEAGLTTHHLPLVWSAAALEATSSSEKDTTRLSLRGNELTAFEPPFTLSATVSPACTKWLSQLTAVDLSGNPQLSSLPSSLAVACPALRGLYLACCNFARLPACVLDMENLQQVDLYNNPPLALPDAAGTWLQDLRERGWSPSFGDTHGVALPRSLKTIDADPLKAKVAVGSATWLLRTELARNVCRNLAPDADALFLWARSLDSESYAVLEPDLTWALGRVAQSWQVNRFGHTRLSTFHHQHPMIPGTCLDSKQKVVYFGDDSGDGVELPDHRSDITNVVCDLCSAAITSSSSGFFCGECNFDICDSCGTFLLGPTHSTTSERVRLVSCGVRGHTGLMGEFFVDDSDNSLCVSITFPDTPRDEAVDFQSLDGNSVHFDESMELVLNGQSCLKVQWVFSDNDGVLNFYGTRRDGEPTSIEIFVDSSDGIVEAVACVLFSSLGKRYDAVARPHGGQLAARVGSIAYLPVDDFLEVSFADPDLVGGPSSRMLLPVSVNFAANGGLLAARQLAHRSGCPFRVDGDLASLPSDDEADERRKAQAEEAIGLPDAPPQHFYPLQRLSVELEKVAR